MAAGGGVFGFGQRLFLAGDKQKEVITLKGIKLRWWIVVLVVGASFTVFVYLLKAGVDDDLSRQLTEQAAIGKIKMRAEVVDYLNRIPQAVVGVDHEEDDSYSVHVYEITNGHTATFGWYLVNRTTGEITTAN